MVVENESYHMAAIQTGGRTRLRPILMTTAAMIMGMVPLALALGLGDGAEQRAPMAHAIIGGLVTSTLLTLVVVPVVYTYLDDLRGRVGRSLRWEKYQSIEGAERPRRVANKTGWTGLEVRRKFVIQGGPILGAQNI